MKYHEFILFKGDLQQEGAIYRMGEMRSIFKAFADLLGGEYQEDLGSYAVMVSEKNIPKSCDVQAFRDKVLGFVDLCDNFNDEQVKEKAARIVALSKEKDCPIGPEVIRLRVNTLLMEKLYTERVWEFGKKQ